VIESDFDCDILDSLNDVIYARTLNMRIGWEEHL